MQSRAGWLLIAVGAGALAGSLGVWQITSATRDASCEARALAAVDVQQLVRAELSRATRTLREDLDEQLAARLATTQRVQAAVVDPTSPPASTEVRTPRPEPSNEQKRAYGQARAWLDTSLADGAWGNEERAHLHQVLPQLAPQHRDELMDELIITMNEGELRLDAEGPPL